MYKNIGRVQIWGHIAPLGAHLQKCGVGIINAGGLVYNTKELIHVIHSGTSRPTKRTVVMRLCSRQSRCSLPDWSLPDFQRLELLVGLLSATVNVGAWRLHRQFTGVYIQCVSKKNTPDIFSCNLNKYFPIEIIFGTSITQSLGNRKMVYFPTSHSVSALPCEIKR